MKKIVFLLTAVLMINVLLAQEKILMTIGNHKISKDEFVRIYKKNNSLGTEAEPMSVDDYLDLFVKFKLKVIAAEDAGYDTMKNFIDEYHKYVRLLAKNYYPDSSTLKKLIKKEYERSLQNVHLGYISIFLPRNYSAEDTSKAFQRALKIRERLLSDENFAKVAVEESDSKTVKRDKGDSWYIDVFSLPYALENFAYDHKVGDVSMPIFYNNTYFILKIFDKKPAFGEYKISHIYVRLPQNPSEKDSLKAMDKLEKIKEAFNQGMSFEEVAKKYSEDSYSASKGGDLGWIKPSSGLLTSFKKYAFSIKYVGDSIGPVRTEVGYHYIKLTDKKTPGTFDEEKKAIEENLKKKGILKIAENVTTERLKKEYNFKQHLPLSEITSKIDKKIFQGIWKADTFANDTRILITFDHKKYTVADFGKYLEKHQRLQSPQLIDKYIKEQFDNFVAEKIEDYELDKLPEKIPELKYLSQEYHDGILLFNIMQDSISDISVKDTAGLRAFYNKNKLNYYERLNLEIYTYSSKKGMKTAVKLLKKHLPDSLVIQKVHAKDTSFALYKKGVFKKGQDKTADKIFEKFENKQISSKDRIFVFPEDKKIVVLKNNFKYVRGFVLADYQTYLEDKWVERLKKHYPVKINQDILNEIKKEVK